MLEYEETWLSKCQEISFEEYININQDKAIARDRKYIESSYYL